MSMVLTDESRVERSGTVNLTRKPVPRKERLPNFANASQYMVLSLLEGDTPGKFYYNWDWLRFHS